MGVSGSVGKGEGYLDNVVGADNKNDSADVDDKDFYRSCDDDFNDSEF